jgi:hypothetical protein
MLVKIKNPIYNNLLTISGGLDCNFNSFSNMESLEVLSLAGDTSSKVKVGNDANFATFKIYRAGGSSYNVEWDFRILASTTDLKLYNNLNANVFYNFADHGTFTIQRDGASTYANAHLLLQATTTDPVYLGFYRVGNPTKALAFKYNSDATLELVDQAGANTGIFKIYTLNTTYIYSNVKIGRASCRERVYSYV